MFIAGGRPPPNAHAPRKSRNLRPMGPGANGRPAVSGRPAGEGVRRPVSVGRVALQYALGDFPKSYFNER